MKPKVAIKINRILDLIQTWFVISMIPVAYCFEIIIVLPSFYERWSFWYSYHFVLTNFLFGNILCNYAAVMRCDTSVKGNPPILKNNANGRYCSLCDCLSPLRSWHCSICNSCILKRDHHCNFTSCCIGHYNHRYFFMLMFYMALTVAYETFYNVSFLTKIINFVDLLALMVTFHVGLIPLLNGIEFENKHLYLLFSILMIVAGIFALVHFINHVHLIMEGLVTIESGKSKRKKHIINYNCGTLENIRNVLGKRWYLVWISPFMKSELLHDGYYWNAQKCK